MFVNIFAIRYIILHKLASAFKILRGAKLTRETIHYYSFNNPFIVYTWQNFKKEHHFNLLKTSWFEAILHQDKYRGLLHVNVWSYFKWHIILLYNNYKFIKGLEIDWHVMYRNSLFWPYCPLNNELRKIPNITKFT